MKYLAAEDLASVIGRNQLRQYPGAKRGRNRLLPFARPQATAKAKIPTGARFFVVGNCFARSIEKALIKAGQKVLSSRFNPDLPGDAVKQFQRFNIFTLDVSTNEIAWATGIDDNMDRALIEVDDQLVDMQLHFTMAFAPDEAQRFRASYNRSYADISAADVVIAVTGGMRQWYDKQAGIYLNSMPTRRMISLYPKRFELHEMDVTDAQNNIQRFLDTLRKSNPDALVLIAVSPVSSPASYSSEDALIDQLLSKSTQRSALAKVCDANQNVEYLPALDTAILSDFRYGYMANSLNHTLPNVGYRVIADMMRQRMEPSKGQRIVEALGYGEALSLAEDFEGVADLLRPMVLGEDGELGEIGAENVAVHRLYALSLMRMGQRKEALAHVIKVLRARAGRSDLLRDDSMDEDTSDELQPVRGPDLIVVFFNLGADLCRMFGSPQDHAFMAEFARANGMDTTRLDDAAMKAKGVRPEILEMAEAFARGEFKKVWNSITSIDAIRTELSDKERRRVDQLAMQSSIKLGLGSQGIQRILDLIKAGLKPDRDLILQLVNNSRAHANREQLADVIVLGRDAKIDALRLENLETRLKFLQSRTASVKRQTPPT